MDELLANNTPLPNPQTSCESEDTLNGKVDQLQQDNARLQQENEALSHNYAQVLEKLAFFEEQLRLLKHQQFGRSSEQTSPAQGLLFNGQAGASPETSPETTTVTYERKKKNPPKRNQFPAHWPRREILHDIDQLEKVDVQSNPLTLIGYDEFEQVRVSPASHEVIVHRRPKYAKEADDGSTQVLQAPPALVPLPKSLASPSLLADIITSKFVEHLPLHRYEQRCARVDFNLPRSTQARWLMRLCEDDALLQPLASLLLDKLRVLTVLR